MAMAVAKAKEVEADLVVASDPDADRHRLRDPRH